MALFLRSITFQCLHYYFQRIKKHHQRKQDHLNDGYFNHMVLNDGIKYTRSIQSLLLPGKCIYKF